MLFDPDIKRTLSKEELRRLDRKLMVAWEVLQDETCQRCGVVSWFGRSDNPEIEFPVKQSTCYSCAELEKAEEARNKDKNSKEYGVTRYPVPQMTKYTGQPRSELPNREEWVIRVYQDYMGEMAKDAMTVIRDGEVT